MAEFMLSTSDNPFNPFTQFKAWHSFDESKGYNSSEYLARIAVVSPSLSPAELETSIEDAIDEIIKINPFGIHIKVAKPEEN